MKSKCILSAILQMVTLSTAAQSLQNSNAKEADVYGLEPTADIHNQSSSSDREAEAASVLRKFLHLVSVSDEIEIGQYKITEPDDLKRFKEFLFKNTYERIEPVTMYFKAPAAAFFSGSEKSCSIFFRDTDWIVVWVGDSGCDFKVGKDFFKTYSGFLPTTESKLIEPDTTIFPTPIRIQKIRAVP